MLYGSPTWEVQSIDISKWNGQMNFAITRTKCQYVTIRYGYGNGWKDPSADQFYRDARAQDMPVSAYWFCNIGEDPDKHVNGFAEELLSKPVQLDIHLDFERTIINPSNPSQTLEWIKLVDGKINGKTGKIEVPYTSKGFWDGSVARSSYWINKKLWDANWTTRDYPAIPLDFTGWEEWQWSADGNKKASEYGSTNGDPDMDLDRSCYTVVQFNAKYGTHIQPIGGTQPPPGTVPDVVIIGGVDINIRLAPNPSDPLIVIGIAQSGKKWYPEAIEKDQYGSEWYKVGKKAYIKKALTRLP